MNDVVLSAVNVSRIFPMAAGPVVAVRDITLTVRQGEHTAIRGPSGCGKSTLLHMLGCVDAPSSGTLKFDGRDVATLDDRERSLLRLRHIGFVFQRFFLLPMLTAPDVELPQSEAGVRSRTRRRSLELLEYVGLAARAITGVAAFGGEMQRVAIARALATGATAAGDEPPESSIRRRRAGGQLLDRSTPTAPRYHRDATACSHSAPTGATMKDGRIDNERHNDRTPGRAVARRHPVRSAVLSAVLGGRGVMAILLGVAEIVLDQARAPALVGGGDVVIRWAPTFRGSSC